jgi:hypothetical protein
MSAPRCPFCDASGPERVGQWGGQIITAQWRCRSCNSYFEAVRDDFAEPPDRRNYGPEADATTDVRWPHSGQSSARTHASPD